MWSLFLYNADQPQNSETPDNQAEQHDEDLVIEGEPNIYAVELNNSNSDPITAQVKIGDYIQFSGDDDMQHQIIQSGDGEHGDEELDSGVLEPGQAYRVRFSGRRLFCFGRHIQSRTAHYR